MVAAGEAFDPSPSNIESRVVRSTLPDGMKMSLLSRKTRGGTVVATVTIRYGDEKSLVGKSAIAGITGGLLMRGTKNKSRQQIQDEMDRLKAQVNVSGGPTNASASIETIEANLPGALRLAAEILREPAFPDSEFETVRQQRIAAAEASRSDPQALAQIAFQRRMNPYPRGDARYVSTADEAIEDLKKVTLDDVRKFYQQFYGASVGEIAVSGQFNVPEITKLATELFGNWKSPGSYSRLLSSYRKIDPANQKIETPDKQNAVFLAGEPSEDERRRSRLRGGRDGELHVRRQRPRHAPLAPHTRYRRPQLRRLFAVRRAPEGRWRQPSPPSPSAIRRTPPKWKPASAMSSPRPSRTVSPPTKSLPPRRPGFRSAA